MKALAEPRLEGFYDERTGLNMSCAAADFIEETMLTGGGAA
ncbi:hypothetical protein J2857_004650 [Neorhizobium galegae]|nr:hypothetical protein [Neorhizobium galegae]